MKRNKALIFVSPLLPRAYTSLLIPRVFLFPPSAFIVAVQQYWFGAMVALHLFFLSFWQGVTLSGAAVLRIHFFLVIGAAYKRYAEQKKSRREREREEMQSTYKKRRKQQCAIHRPPPHIESVFGRAWKVQTAAAYITRHGVQHFSLIDNYSVAFPFDLLVLNICMGVGVCLLRVLKCVLLMMLYISGYTGPHISIDR